jgi:hypothetical protein
MNYPLEILPDPTYKLIDCDLADHIIIRFTNTKDVAEILDPVTKTIKTEFVCSQSDHINDLSMSLLGIFKPDHVCVDFTKQGIDKYMHYCPPDVIVDPPVFETEFKINKDRYYWWIPVAKLHKVKFPYTRSGEPYDTTCYVCHTPMLWNFWHFSLRWHTELGKLEDLDEKLRNKVSRRIGQAVRVLIAQNASIEKTAFKPIKDECFVKS